MSSVLHVLVGHLPAESDADPRLATALELGRALPEAPGVQHALLGRSTEHVVAVCWLGAPNALEPFAESSAHMAFVMRGLAPLVRGMWSVSVATATRPPVAPGDAAALWAFAVPERPGVYEWEVRRLLDDLAGLPGLAATGPTVEDRERFRAGGVVFLAARDLPPFEAELAVMRAEWPAFAAEIEEALVPVPRAPAPAAPHERPPA